MEAMVVGYPADQSGQISVTATKEEWRRIMDDLTKFIEPDGPGADLVYWLINQGAYE